MELIGALDDEELEPPPDELLDDMLLDDELEGAAEELDELEKPPEEELLDILRFLANGEVKNLPLPAFAAAELSTAIAR